MSDLNLKLKISADSVSAQKQLNAVTAQSKAMSRQLSATNKTASQLGPAVARNAAVANNSIAAISQSTSNLRSDFLALAGVASLFTAGANVIGLADEYTLLESRLKLVTDSAEELADIQDKLAQQADDNRQDLSAVTQLYAGITPTLKEFGKSQEDILRLTNLVSQSLVIGGATVQQSAAAQLQLNQAIASGVLRGDEFNSLMENAPALMRSFADSLGVPVGKLRAMAEQGKLTSDILVDGLLSQSDEIAGKFDQMAVTVGQSMTVLRNNILRGVADLDEYTGASEALASGIRSLAGNLDVLATAGLGLAAVYGGRLLQASAAQETGIIRRTKLRITEAATVRQTAAVEATALRSTAVEHARVSRALLASAQRKKALASTNLALAKAEISAAQAAKLQTAAEAQNTQSAHVAAAAAVRYTNALNQLSVAQRASVAASRGVIAARGAEATATATAASVTAGAAAKHTLATRAMGLGATSAAVASRGLSAALMLVGGPVGAALISVIALAAYKDELIDMVSWSDDAKKATAKHGESMLTATSAAYEYADATEEVRDRLREEKTAALEAGKAEIKLAQSRVLAAQSRLDAANKLADHVRATGSADNPEGYAFQQTDTEERELKLAKSTLEASKQSLKELDAIYANFGKTKDELDASFKNDEGLKRSAKNNDELAARLKALGASLSSVSDKKKRAKTDTEKLIEVQQNEIASLEATALKLTLNDQAYYAASLRTRQFDDDTQKLAKSLNYKNAILTKEKALLAARRDQETSIRVQYQYELDQAGIVGPDASRLINDKMSDALNAEKRQLQERASLLGLNTQEQYKASLAAKGFNTAAVDEAASINLGNIFRQQRLDLDKLRAGLDTTISGQYRIELKDQGITGPKADTLVDDRMSIALKAENKQLTERSKLLGMNAQEQYEASLAAKGFEDAAISEAGALNLGNTLRAERLKLDKLRAGLDTTISGQYRIELKDQGITGPKADTLVDDRMSIALKAENKQLTERSKLLGMNAQEQYEASLAAKGFEDAAISEAGALNLGNTLRAERLKLDKLRAGLDTTISGQYRIELSDQGITGPKADTLVDDRMSIALKAENKQLTERSKLLGLNAQEQYEASLAAKGFEDAAISEAGALNLGNTLRAERLKLDKLRAGLDTTISGQYRLELNDQGIQGPDADALVDDRMSIEFDKRTDALEKQREVIGLYGQDLAALSLKNEGFSASQIAMISSMEQQNTRLQQWRDVAFNAFDGVGDRLSDLVTTGKADWRGLVADMLKQALELMVIKPMIDSLKSAFSGIGGGGGSFLGNLFGGLFAKGAAFTAGTTMAFAAGGAFADGGLVHDQAFASGGAFTNQVVSSPTMFAMAGNQLGLMGEAGPEAIMPLTRAADGSLGVRAVGGNGNASAAPMELSLTPQILLQQQAPVINLPSLPSDESASGESNIVIHVHNNGTNQQVDITETRDEDRRIIDVFINDISTGGRGSQALERTYPNNKRRGL